MTILFNPLFFDMQNPKVFISHASEDKERFVLDFAKKLRAKGVDAWVDKWEMLPGDSLIDKVFEEGIGQAQAVIVVLSQYSINKPWVKEEINASFVKRVNEGSILIPVVLDVEDEQVPECLKSTVWERIEDLNNYENELDRIVNAIYGHREKPPLGEPPPYTQTDLHLLPGLEQIDTIVFTSVCEKAIATDMAVFIRTEEVFEVIENTGVDFEALLESLAVLEGQMYIDNVDDNSTSYKKRIINFGVSRYGLEQYLRSNLTNYYTILKQVGTEIVNKVDIHHSLDSKTIAEELKVPHLIVTHILSIWNDNGWVYCTPNNMTPKVRYLVRDILSPELKRWLRRT